MEDFYAIWLQHNLSSKKKIKDNNYMRILFKE